MTTQSYWNIAKSRLHYYAVFAMSMWKKPFDSTTINGAWLSECTVENYPVAVHRVKYVGRELRAQFDTLSDAYALALADAENVLDYFAMCDDDETSPYRHFHGWEVHRQFVGSAEAPPPEGDEDPFVY